MAEWQDAPELAKLAADIVAVRPEVAHVEVDDILFLRELETKPGGTLARTYRLVDHPIGFYITARFAIVVYDQNTDYMSANQLAILVLHELMHIPELGDKLVDHDVKDFRSVLGIDLDWARPGQEVMDILE